MRKGIPAFFALIAMTCLATVSQEDKSMPGEG
jgi:hypothetical protein